MRPFFVNLRSHLQIAPQPHPQHKPTPPPTDATTPFYDYDEFLQEKSPLLSKPHEPDLEASPPATVDPQAPTIWCFTLLVLILLSNVLSYYVVLAKLAWLNEVASLEMKSFQDALVTNSATYYAMSNAKIAGLLDEDEFGVDAQTAAVFLQVVALFVGCELCYLLRSRGRVQRTWGSLVRSYVVITSPSLVLCGILGAIVVQMKIAKACGCYLGGFE
jgi:hypothetical protein